ncbi:hypothetical protein ACFL35_18965 [Candidatus Riflebacteria bacterium]
MGKKDRLFSVTKSESSTPRFHFQISYSLLELVLVLSIIAVMTYLGMPIAKIIVVRSYEQELKRSLKIMREAIDHYREDKLYTVGYESDGTPKAPASYPQTLQKLVEEKDSLGIKFLREIPKIPFYNTINWEVRSSAIPYMSIHNPDPKFGDGWMVVTDLSKNPFKVIDPLVDHRIFDVRFPRRQYQGGAFYQAIDGSYYYDW